MLFFSLLLAVAQAKSITWCTDPSTCPSLPEGIVVIDGDIYVGSGSGEGISMIPDDGNYVTLSNSSFPVWGLRHSDGKIYGASSDFFITSAPPTNGLLKYDLALGEGNVTFCPGATFLNDLTIIGNFAYVTDTIGGSIFKIGLMDDSCEEWMTAAQGGWHVGNFSAGVLTINGIVGVGGTMFLVSDFGGGEIYLVDVLGKTSDELISLENGGCDGMSLNPTTGAVHCVQGLAFVVEMTFTYNVNDGATLTHKSNVTTDCEGPTTLAYDDDELWVTCVGGTDLDTFGIGPYVVETVGSSSRAAPSLLLAAFLTVVSMLK